jgi:putative hydroxymethylpyrimidine transporter CytX
MIWFGAAVSIAEIITGTLVAPLGLAQGAAAILLGHLIGAIPLALVAYIGAKLHKNAMESVKTSFGNKGGLLFSGLNVLQLVGWSAVMIAAGQAAATLIWDVGANWIWAVVLAALIIVWVIIGERGLSVLSTVAVVFMCALCVLLTVLIFGGSAGVGGMGGFGGMGGLEALGGAPADAEPLSFGAAVELSVAMPLSWLPVIADYTKNSDRPVATSIASAGTYTVVSCWMFIIGLGAALFTAQSDVAQIYLAAGLGVAGLAVILLSTVTTTFLDVNSSAISAISICSKLRRRPVAIVTCLLALAIAIFAPVESYEEFLYLISSVFAPMCAVQIADYFVVRRWQKPVANAGAIADSTNTSFNWLNLAVWLLGFALSRFTGTLDLPIGTTLPLMLLCFVLTVLVNWVANNTRKQTADD